MWVFNLDTKLKPRDWEFKTPEMRGLIGITYPRPNKNMLWKLIRWGMTAKEQKVLRLQVTVT